jgi:hypothetical protein
LFVPKHAGSARGTVFLEVVNRGRDQSLGLLSGAQQPNLAPESWVLGDGFLLEQGFTVAFLGWQFDVRPAQGLTFQAPVAPVQGTVRESYVEYMPGRRITNFPLTYCSVPDAQNTAVLTFRRRMDDRPEPIPREEWQFRSNGCAVHFASGFDVGLYEAVYEAKGSPIAALGLAAVRDFASYLRNGLANAVLRENPATLRRIIGYGYSQSARFLRDFVRDGFNADENGRAAFDGLMISSAGAGGGSFNHRFAMPGQAGNSVLSVLRPVDLPPFTDEPLLTRARTANVTPKIFYTFSSTEYWARAGSLTHTTEDGKRDVPFAETSRLYFIGGTPHASGPLPLAGNTRGPMQPSLTNFAQQRWVLRALLMDLDDWVQKGTDPPSSRYPTIANRQLVPLSNLRFPRVPAFRSPTYMPQVWRMDFGSQFRKTGVITNEPPRLGAPYPLLLPQVNADGNEIAGIRPPEIAVPLGTYTAWNMAFPQLEGLGYLSGLSGSFKQFALTREDRQAVADARPSIEERYSGREDYLDRVRKAAEGLVKDRFLLRADVPAVLRRAEDMWDVFVGK